MLPLDSKNFSVPNCTSHCIMPPEVDSCVEESSFDFLPRTLQRCTSTGTFIIPDTTFEPIQFEFPLNLKKSVSTLFNFSDVSSEILSSFSLLYNSVQFDNEYSWLPPGDLDTERLKEGVAPFIKNTRVSDWHKCVIVISAVCLDDCENSLAQLYFEKLISSLFLAGFDIRIVSHHEILKVENLFIITEQLKRATHSNQENLFRTCSKSKIYPHQIFWINWQNIRKIYQTLSECEEIEMRDFFSRKDFEKSYYDLDSSGLGARSIIKLVNSHGFIESYNPDLPFEAFFDLSLEKIEHIIQAILLLPPKSKVEIYGSGECVQQVLSYFKPSILISLKINLELQDSFHKFELDLSPLKTQNKLKHFSLFTGDCLDLLRGYEHIFSCNEEIEFSISNFTFEQLPYLRPSKILKLLESANKKSHKLFLIFNFDESEHELLKDLENIKKIKDCVSQFSHCLLRLYKSKLQSYDLFLNEIGARETKVSFPTPKFSNKENFLTNEINSTNLQTILDSINIGNKLQNNILYIKFDYLSLEQLTLIINACSSLNSLVIEIAHLTNDKKFVPYFSYKKTVTSFSCHLGNIDECIEWYLILLNKMPNLLECRFPRIKLDLSLITLNFLYIAENLSIENTEWALYSANFPNLKHLVVRDACRQGLNDFVTINIYGNFKINSPYENLKSSLNETLHIPQYQNCFCVNSGNVTQNFEVQEIFPHLSPSHYRKEILKIFWENQILFDQTVIPLPYTISIPLANDELPDHIGTITLELNSKWSPLSGISCSDKLVFIECIDRDISLLAVGYDESTSLYYVRSDGFPFNATIRYGLKSNSTQYWSDFSGDPPDRCGLSIKGSELEIDQSVWPMGTPLENLQKLVSYFRAFTLGKPVFKYANNSVVSFTEILNSVLEQRTGAACLQRAQLFCLIAPFVVKGLTDLVMVKNDCHAFVSFKFNHQKHDVDLGGYPAELTVVKPFLIQQKETLFAKGMECTVQSSETYPDFCSQILDTLSHKKNKQALLIAEDPQIPALHLTFQRLAKSKNLPFTFMDIQNRELFSLVPENGKLVKKPNSLSRILKDGGIILLDLSHLSVGNISALSNLTDPLSRSLQSIRVSCDTLIIAFISEKQPFSPDTARRFSIIQKVKDFPAIDNPNGKYVLETAPLHEESSLSVDLYEDEYSWKSLLVEKISASGGIVPGILVKCCLEMKTHEKRIVKILNPPADPKFYIFLRQLDTGTITYKGQTLILPENLKIYLEKSDSSLVVIERFNTLQIPHKVLNEATFSHFIPHLCIQGNNFYTTPGILASYSKKTFILLVSDSLSDIKWRRILDEVQKYQINLIVVNTAKVEFPQFIEFREIQAPTKVKSNIALCVDRQILIEKFLLKCPDCVLITVTKGMVMSDVFPRITNVGKDNFDFTLEKGQIWELIEAGKKIVLTGEFSKKFINELATLTSCKNPTFYLNGEFYPIRRKVFIASSQRSLFGSLPYYEIENSEEQRSDLYQSLSLAFQERRSAEYQLEIAGIDKTFRNVLQLSKYNNANLENPLDLFCLQQERPVEYTKRLARVIDVLNIIPMVFIYGPPASGKSFFIYSQLKQSLPEYTYFYSTLQIEPFLTSPTKSILCIDEADLNPELISKLECILLNKPVFFNRRLHDVVEGSKIILTGNGSFANRKELSFIHDFGGAIYFGNLPEWEIKNSIVLPLLEGTDKYDACDRIFELAKKLKHQGTEFDLRHFGTLCALSRYYATISPFDNVHNIDWCFIDLFPEIEGLENQKILLKKFIDNQVPNWLRKKGWTSEFILTPSRTNVIWKLICQLEIRQRKIQGGQKAFVIEGPPGEGKTALVASLLRISQEEFITINLSEDPQDVIHQLQDAFKYGKLVVIDEFDGFYEEVLNSILTGVGGEGEMPEKDGFFIIGTANTGIYWRLPRSAALYSRAPTIVQKPYSADELKTIAMGIGIAESEAESIVQNHLDKIALTQHEVLKPTAADLFAYCRDLIESKERTNKRSHPIEELSRKKRD